MTAHDVTCAECGTWLHRSISEPTGPELCEACDAVLRREQEDHDAMEDAMQEPAPETPGQGLHANPAYDPELSARMKADIERMFGKD